MDNITNKQLTRKQFLLAGLSLVGLLVASKLPKILSGAKDSLTLSNDKTNVYGNNSYGGGKKNV